MTPHEAAGDKYTVDGLLALYEYEPSLRDIYVEGRTDAGLLRWYLRRQGLAATVRAIDDVAEIPANEVRQLGFDVNARGRALALAAALGTDLDSSRLTPIILVDADWYGAVGPQLVARRLLLMTDMAAMENYCLQPRPLQKFLDAVLSPVDQLDADVVIGAISNALIELHSVRIVLHRLGEPGARNPAALATLQPGASTIDKAELIRRSCRSGSYPEAARAGLLAEADWYEAALRDSGQGGRGHDIAPMLVAYLDLGGHIADLATLEAALRGCLEAGDLGEWPVFREVSRRLAPASAA